VYSAVKFNSIRRYNNKSQKTIDISDIHEEQFAADFHDQIEYAELQHAISQTIENLPPQCRRIFKMSRFEKLTYKEIANSLGISQKTVEAQISKALRNIQKTLRKYLITIILLLCCIC
jgi:RNA polymerase sigma-70 factor (ECF subfamily)